VKSSSDGLISRLTNVYGEPRSDDPVGYLRELRAALAGWDEHTLNTAASRLIKVAKFWPRPAEIIEIAEQIAAEKVLPRQNPTEHGDFTTQAFVDANRLIRSDLGKQAAKEGWVGQLHDFCRRTRALPNERQIRDLKHEARLFDEAYTACVEGRGGTLNDALKRMGDSFIEKRARLAQIVEGAAS